MIDTLTFMSLCCPPAWFVFETAPVYDPYDCESFMVWHQIWEIIQAGEGIRGAFGMWN